MAKVNGGGDKKSTPIPHVGNLGFSKRIEVRSLQSNASRKAIQLSLAICITLASAMMADTCQEVVRDASGRVVKTIQHQKSSNGTVSSTTQDAAGRIIGTSTSRESAGGSTTSIAYRDASGRLTGRAATQTSTKSSSRTTYCDPSGRTAGSTGTLPLAAPAAALNTGTLLSASSATFPPAAVRAAS